MLVRVGATEILVGVAAGSVNTLHVFPEGCAITGRAARAAGQQRPRMPNVQGPADAEPRQMKQILSASGLVRPAADAAAGVPPPKRR